jgi:multiple sugar transport system substrate-binding protein
MTTPKAAAPKSPAKVNGRSRRQFLRTALALCGGALAVAGGADLAINGLTLNPNAAVSKFLSSNAITGTGQANYTPDYLDFLEFLKSVSDKVPSKSVITSLEAEFAPYSLEAVDPSFLQYSGIAAEYNPAPYLIQLQQVQFTVSTKSPSYDILSIDNQNIASFENGIISPLVLQQRYPELTYKNYNVSDFQNTVWNYVAEYPPVTPNFTQSGANSGPSTSRSSFTLFPFDDPLMVLFYRKDIYDKMGFSPPTTWDEYYAQCQKLGGNGTAYASVSMANGDISVVYEYLNHLASFGGSMWNIDGNSITPNLTSSECVEALANYVRFQPYADPASSYYTWTDQFNSLAQGFSATALLWDDYYAWLNQPARSPVAAGQFVPTINPAGPAGSFSTYGGSGLGVSAFSNRPEAAYLWIQWATVAGTQEEMLLGQYHNFPTRASVLNVPQIQQAVEAGSLASFNVAKQAWATGTTALIPFPQWLNVLVNLSVSLHNAWIGYWTPLEALTNAQNFIEQNYPNLTFT